MVHLLIAFVRALAVLCSLLLGLITALVVFICAAHVTSSVGAMAILALISCSLVTGGLAWLAGFGISSLKRHRIALGTMAASVFAVGLLAFLFVIKPTLSADKANLPDPPEGTRYWELSTGSRIAYLEVPADKPARSTPVVFLHGGPGGNVVSVEPIVRALTPLATEGYTLFFYDQVGGGFSSRLADVTQYTLARHVADLEAVRAQIGSPKMILIAQSWGGVLAARYMVDFPHRVETTVFISPGGFDHSNRDSEVSGNIKDRVPPSVLRKALLDAGPRLAVLEELVKINPEAAHRFLPEPAADVMGTRLLSALLVGAVCDPSAKSDEFGLYFGTWCQLMTNLDLENHPHEWQQRLLSNPTPILILRGECDYLKSMVTERYLQLFKKSTLVAIQGAGHFVWFEKPQEVFSRIRDFLLDDPGRDMPQAGQSRKQ